jgi:hypothetical protein
MQKSRKDEGSSKHHFKKLKKQVTTAMMIYSLSLHPSHSLGVSGKRKKTPYTVKIKNILTLTVIF